MAVSKSFVNARAVEPGLRREIAAIYHRMLPYGGSFYDDDDQVTAGSDLMNIMSFGETVLSAGVQIDGGTKIRFEFPGWYVISFSAQLEKPSANAAEVDIWLRKNGANVDWSNTAVWLAGSAARKVAAWDFMVDARLGDYYELAWSSAANDVELHASPAASSPDRPGIPSVILNVWPVFGFSVTS
jgi:hypothetical protein